MDEQKALDFIARQEWIFAKTRPRNPHWYIVRKKVGDDDAFNEFLLFIRRNGEKRIWGGKLYQVWYAPDGHHYWTMGWPAQETTVINRTRSEDLDQTTAPDPDREYRWMSKDGREPPMTL